MEDNSADLLLIRRAIRQAGLEADIQVANDGEQAIRLFQQFDLEPSAPCPTLVILDINLPRKQGSEVLQYMRETGRCPEAIVLAVSTSDSPDDRNEMAKWGVDGYFRKPSEVSAFMQIGQVIKGLLSRGLV